MAQAGARLAVAAVSVLIFGTYWSPSLVAAVRRHPRMGLVLLFNFLGVFAVPWIWAWVTVLAEPSRRPRKLSAAVPADPRVVPFQRGGAA